LTNKTEMTSVIIVPYGWTTRKIMHYHILSRIAQVAATAFSVFVVLLSPTAHCQNQPLSDNSVQTNAESYRPVLEHGLNHQFEFTFFPVGKVRIMGPQESEITERMGQGADWQRLEFPGRMLAFLEQAEKDGLVKIEEQKVEGLGVLLTQGARFFTVLPTEKLIKLQDATSSSSAYIKVRVGTFNVTEIISDEAFTPPKGVGGPGDQFRLILGKVKDTPTSQSKKLGPNYVMGSGEEFKFRAVMQVNPFTKSREFVMADIGKIDRNDWLSGFVEMGNIPSHLRAPPMERSRETGAGSKKSTNNPSLPSASPIRCRVNSSTTGFAPARLSSSPIRRRGTTSPKPATTARSPTNSTNTSTTSRTRRSASLPRLA
jgi:hypothetical protein